MNLVTTISMIKMISQNISSPQSFSLENASPLPHSDQKRAESKTLEKQEKKKDLTFFTGDAFFSLYFYVLVSKFF